MTTVPRAAVTGVRPLARLLVVLLGAVALALAACGGGDDPVEGAPSPTPTGTAMPEAEATAPGTQPLTIGETIPLPDDVALYVQVLDCTLCNAPAQAIERVYRDHTGDVVRDTLFERRGGPPPPYIGARPLVVSPGGEFIVVECLEGGCPGAPAVSLTDDAVVAFHRSVDGGITWTEAEPVTGPYEVVSANARGDLLAVRRGDNAHVVWLPRGESLHVAPDDGPMLLGDGRLVFWNGTDLVLYERGAAGRTLLSLAGAGESVEVAHELFAAGPGERYAAGWREPRAGGGDAWLKLGIFEGGSSEPALVVTGDFTRVGPWLDEDRLFVQAMFTREQLGTPDDPQVRRALPALLDVRTATLSPIAEPFAEPPYEGGENAVLHVERGPFARVLTDDGTCLNVRRQPDIGAPVVSCMPDDVLLRLVEPPAANAEWARVAGHGGLAGYAATAYLLYEGKSGQ